ncbi:MAG: hypothetical protein JJU33_11965 [Phycisphaerales bacterium]|nr:hypothetical protein [Phycisphaerales bacterium]
MTVHIIIALVLTSFAVVQAVIIFGFVIPMLVRDSWTPIAEAHPPVEPAPDAVVKRWQSFSAGMLNLGWSVDVAVDERHLHLRPSPLGRVIRLRPASVPWEAVEFVREGWLSAKVKIAGRELRGPKWCLTMAKIPEG